MTVIVDRATLRGELPPGTDAADVIRTVTALIYYRLFIAGERASQDIADVAGAAVMFALLSDSTNPAAARASSAVNEPTILGVGVHPQAPDTASYVRQRFLTLSPLRTQTCARSPEVQDS